MTPSQDKPESETVRSAVQRRVSLPATTRAERADLVRIYRWMQKVAEEGNWEDADGTPLSPAAATFVRFAQNLVLAG